MAVSAVIAQASGNQVRSAMMRVDLDGNASFNSGSVLGCTIATSDIDGNPIFASAAVAYTSSEALAANSFISEAVEYFAAQVPSCRVWAEPLEPDQYVIHFANWPKTTTGANPWGTAISTPVFTPA